MKRISPMFALVAVVSLGTPFASARVLDAGTGLTVTTDSPKEAASPAGADLTYTVTATDPSVQITCDDGSSGLGSVTTTATYGVGTHAVNCSGSDGSSVAVPLQVVDTTPPTLTAPSDQTVDATTSGGAVVTFSASATDIADPSPIASCTPGSGTTFPVGPTTVSCTATDASGNTSNPQTFTITVTDKTPPTLSVPGDQTVEATTNGGAIVTFSFSATDIADPSPTVSCAPSSGATFPIGSTTVSCTATDASGNSSGPQSFTVTVSDTTPPTLSLPGPQSLTATSYAGVAYSFAATATDIVDGSVGVNCTPSSGSTFVPGETTVNCTATDSHGNAASGQFTVDVAVIDNPPTLGNVPASVKREASSPAGTNVFFPTPTAIDDVDGPIATVMCTPASGTLFPIGQTTVTCQAFDSHNHVGSATFTVDIVDTTPPVLYVPGDRTYVAPTDAGEPSSSFTRLASATDIADPHPAISTNAPDVAPIGTTVVTFTARDASGNQTSGSSKMTVLPPRSTAPKTPAPDRTPPDEVTGVTAKAGDGVVVVTWKPSKASDFAGVAITRAPADGSSAPQVVYRGSATSFTDRGLKNGVEYRYVVTAFDKSGNASAGAVVVALPKAALLRAPRDGARLKKAPAFRWAAWPNATYYNFQLFYGTTKVLSAWPVKNSFTLHRSWKYEGHRYRLTRGLYRWYVWPGLGARADVQYGDLLGSASFTVVR
jgi:HYR domain/Fibronectin type III domain